jgi:hypothetical protein
MRNNFDIVTERYNATRRKHPPDDLPEMHSRHTRKELCKIYGVSLPTIRRWCQLFGLVNRKPSIPPRPLPDDWAYQCEERLLRREELGYHYHTSGTVIGRWIRESGILPARHCGKCLSVKPAREFHCADARTCQECRTNGRPHPEKPDRIVARGWQRDQCPQFATPGLRYYGQGMTIDWRAEHVDL